MLKKMIVKLTPLAPTVGQKQGAQYQMARGRKSTILAIFLHSMQQKWDQGTLGRQRVTLIGSRGVGPNGPQEKIGYIGHIFAF